MYQRKSFLSMFWKCIYILFLLIFTVILIMSIFIPGKVRGLTDTMLSLPTIFFGVGIALIFIILMLEIMRIKKYRFLIYILLIFSQIILQIYLSLKMQGAQGVDDFDMYLQIGKLTTNISSSWAPYFSFAPNNIVATVIFSGIAKLAQIFCQPEVLFINIFSFLCIDISLLVGYLVMHKYFSQRVCDAYLLVSMLFMPLYIFPLIMYTDPVSVLFLSLGILMFCKVDNNYSLITNIFLLLCSVFFFLMATFVKTNSIIMIIAVIIVLLFNSDLNLRKKFVILMCVVVPIIFIFKVEKDFQNRYVPIQTELNFPYSYWVGIGFNSDTDGTVYKNGLDTWSKTNAYKTREDKDNYNKKYIKEAVNNLGFMGLANLWARKINVQWSMGSMGINSRDYGIAKSFPKIYNYIFGSQKVFILTFSQIIYILILIGCIYNIKGSIWSENKYSVEKLMILFVIGVFLFHTILWEVQERYSFLVIICLLILGSKGLSDISERLAKKRLKNNLEIYVLLCVIGVGLGLVLDYGKTTSTWMESPVVRQNFFRTENLVLKPKTSIKETIYIPKKFNKIDLSIQGNTENLKILLINKDGTIHHVDLEGKVNNLIPKGKYNIVIKNVSEEDVSILIGESEKRLGLLQKPIQGTKNAYLKFQITNSSKGGASKKMLGLWGLVTCIIGMSFIIFNKKILH